MKQTRPVLLLLAGLPGAGKSTLALALGRRLGWPVLDKDTLKTGLLREGAGEQLAGRSSYTLLYDLAHDLVVELGLSLILDSPAAYVQVIEAASAIVTAADARLQAVYCAAGRETREQRVRRRVSKISQPGHPERPESRRWLSEGDGRELFPFLPPDTLVVDTERPLPEAVAEVTARLLAVGARS